MSGKDPIEWKAGMAIPSRTESLSGIAYLTPTTNRMRRASPTTIRSHLTVHVLPTPADR